MLVFGQKLAGFSRDGKQVTFRKDAKDYNEILQQMQGDTLSSARYVNITQPRKKDDIATFYADADGSSYVDDTYETHVEKVDVDGGIEIGPMMKHPHFHVLLTINHWSYVQLDYFKMNQYLEVLFRGQDPHNWYNDGGATVREQYKLIDASGGPFYTDNEKPYVDIRLYPQDNWQDIIAAYVRKGANDVLGAISARAGPVKQKQRETQQQNTRDDEGT